MSTSLIRRSGLPIFFVALFFISPFKATAGKEPIIRILIGNELNASFRADGNQSMLVKGISLKQKKINSLKLINNNGDVKYSINNIKNQWFELPKNFTLVIKNNDKRGIWFKNRRYAGKLKVSLNNDKIQIINYLKLEKYLKSVVGSEMPKEFPIAALQAQAIAARTYALKLLGKNKFFDVQSTQASQVYLGLEAETPKIIRAVRSTSALALFYNNRLINAVFHSSSGGRTEDSGQVWKYQLPYLKSVIDYDQESSKYNWSRQFNSKELASTFSALGGVNGMQVIKKSNSNRVLEVIVYGPNGKEIISGKELRRKLKLLSTKFELGLEFNQIKKDESNIKNDSQLELHSIPLIPKDYFLLIQGFGAGHGVGMSQWGAKAMAEKGASFRKILRHYYSGVQIKTY